MNRQLPSVIFMMFSLDFYAVRQLYQSGGLRPSTLVRKIYNKIPHWADHNIWIHLLPEDVVLMRARQLEDFSPEQQQSLPLFGIPFAVKDNIDVAGLPTTAGCAAFAYVADETATAVQKLLDAGAILIGKTNMDQFATGLVGTRSPFGACKNAFDGRYISGGSSSGSAVAVAAGLVSFALGTDTAGSGRVPAAFNNIVGLKPTRGLISTKGVVPACRSLDCVSIFALTCADAYDVLAVCAGEDAGDPFSRSIKTAESAEGAEGENKGKPLRDLRALRGKKDSNVFRFGIPQTEQLDFFGNGEAEAHFAEAVAQLQALGGTAVPVDYAPFLQVAELLYDGPWVAERLAAIEPFFQTHSYALLPVTADIIGAGAGYTAVDSFNALYKLRTLEKQIAPVWEAIDLLVLPTAGTIYTIAAVNADPVTLNSNLGIYTNFVNLLDLCALSLPNAMQMNGLPTGITLLALAFQDGWLHEIGTKFQYARDLPLGATQRPLPPCPPANKPQSKAEIELAVFGLHLTGQPLNYQLTDLGAVFVRADNTAASYRLFDVGGKPGAVWVNDGGTAVDLEIWKLPVANLGYFVAQVPPLGIGTVQLADGSSVKGFICEGYVVEQAKEITQYGGWLAYLEEIGD